MKGKVKPVIEVKTKHFSMEIKNSKDIELLEKEVREINKLKRAAIEDLDSQNRLEFSQLLEQEYQQWLVQKELGVIPEDQPSPGFDRAVEEVFHDKENQD